MNPSHSSVSEILAPLRGLRRRVRGLLTVIGGARLLVALGAALGLFFLADYFLDLPLGVRRFVRLGLLDRPDGLAVLAWLPLLALALFLTFALARSRRPGAMVCAFLAGGIVGVLALVAVRAFRPIRAGLSDSALAMAVEQRHAHLGDRLASALDFERELKAPSRGESPAMMAHVVGEAVDAVKGLPIAKTASPARAARWSLAAGGVLAALGLTAAVWPDEVGLWMERSIQLEDVEWPRETTVVAVAMTEDGTISRWEPSRAYEVSLGRPLTVYARAEGEIPDEVHVVDFVEGQDPLARRMYALPDREGIFAFEFRDVRQPFAFYLEGGDDLDGTPRYRVEITIPPRIESMESEITLPAYLGGTTEVQPGGSTTVAAGSTVEVRFRTDTPLARATVLLGDRRLDAGRGADAQSYSFRVLAEKTLRYRLLLETDTGRTNEVALDSYEIRVRNDRAPRVQWIYPRAGVEVTPTGRIPLLVRASDDHAVQSVVLEGRLGDKDVLRWTLQPRADEPDDVDPTSDVRYATDGPYGRKQVLCYYAVDLADLAALLPPSDGTEGPGALEAGDQLAFRVIATDSRGQTREGEWTRADLYSPLERERILVSRRPTVRQALVQLQSEQDERFADLEGALANASADDVKDTLRTVRFSQGRIAQDAQQVTRQLIDLFNGYVLDRMGARSPNAKILGYFDRHHRTSFGLPPSGAEDTAAPAPDTASAVLGDPVWPYALYEDIVTAWKRNEINDRAMIERMLAVIDEAVALAAHITPEAQAASVKALSGRPEDMRAALEAQTQVRASLEKLLARMKDWQSLSDVTWRVRDLLEKQRALRDSLENDGG